MGAVSTRGVRRDRRLAKRNSPLYGPMQAHNPACARFAREMTDASLVAAEDATGRSTLPRASSGLRDGRKGTVFCCVVDLPRNAAATTHQACFAFQKVERRPDRYCSRSTCPLTLNATDCRLPVNRCLTSSYVHRRRSAQDSAPPNRRRFRLGRLFVAVAVPARIRRGACRRRTVPDRSARSGGSAGLCRCPALEAAASWRADRCSRTGPCRRPPGP